MKILKSLYNSLTIRVIVALCFISIIPLVLNLFLNYRMLSGHLFELEKDHANLRMVQAQKYIISHIKNTEEEARDYGAWNDMYDSVKTNDIAWINQNVRDWIPWNTDIDLIVVASSEKTILNSYGLKNNILEKLFSNKSIADLITEKKYDDIFSIGGIEELDGDLYLIGASPIIRTDDISISQGVVIYGRKVDDKFIQQLKNELGYDIFFFYRDKLITSLESTVKDEFKDKWFNNTEKNSYSIEMDKKYSVNQIEITDISNNKIGYLGIIEESNIFSSTIDYMLKYGKRILVLTMVIVIILGFALPKFILRPINELRTQISEMIESKKLKHVSIKGPKEVISLSKAFNELVDNIHIHEREKKSLKAITNIDSLTSLYNHKYFYEYLNSGLLESSTPLSILFCDVDRFKMINDKYGHSKGDIVLKNIAECIKNSIGEDDKAFRYGGEEFVIILENSPVGKAYHLAEKLRLNIINSKSLQRNFSSVPITISIGIASYPIHAFEIHDLIDKADRAMYSAKHTGRNRSEIYNEETDKLIRSNESKTYLEDIILDSAFALVAAIDAKDMYTGKHSEYVTKYALLLADKLNLSEQEKYLLRIGALLHDCGKIGIPDHIINKSTSLTSEEFEIIKEHTRLGHNIIRYIIKDPTVISCVRNHHERWDGKGYPDKLEGTNIPLCARIVGLSDAYHAMTSDRPYRTALSHKEAIVELKKGKGTQFDPELVDVFVSAILKEKEILETIL